MTSSQVVKIVQSYGFSREENARAA